MENFLVNWHIFYNAGRMVLEGKSPYTAQGFFNPVVAAWFLAPTTIIPFSVWVWLMIAISFTIVIWIAKRNSHWVLLSLPFIHGMSNGTLDLFLLAGMRLGGFWYSLITLKPQLAAIVLPFQFTNWIKSKDYKSFAEFAAGTLFLWGLPTLIQPSWVTEWIRVLPSLQSRCYIGATFCNLMYGAWPFYIIMFVGILTALLISNNPFHLTLSFTPALWVEDYLIGLERISWRFTVLGWTLLLFLFSLNVQWPAGQGIFGMLGILMWAEQENVQTWVSAQARKLTQNWVKIRPFQPFTKIGV